jgi:hypothetical protein
MLYLAEFYLPDAICLAELARRARAAGPAATGADGPDGVDGADSADGAGFVLAIHVPADETCFALYDAQAAEAVVSAGARAGIAFERVAAAVLSWPSHRSPPGPG